MAQALSSESRGTSRDARPCNSSQPRPARLRSGTILHSRQRRPLCVSPVGPSSRPPPPPRCPPLTRFLRRLTATATDMSCVPAPLALAAAEALQEAGLDSSADHPGAHPRCAPDALLPCFLTFADYDSPRSDFSNMRCYPVQRKPAAAAARDCPGGSAPQLDDAADPGTQLWDLSPAYYQFRNCRCLPGFYERWSNNDTQLTCEAVARGAMLPAWTWVLVALGVVLALLAGAIALLGSRWVLFRSRWAREMELKRKRARGPPKSGGPVSVVVTDIEGYSGGAGRWQGGVGWGGVGWENER
jgi:hypothetical protein